MSRQSLRDLVEVRHEDAVLLTVMYYMLLVSAALSDVMVARVC